ncbi:tetratricopeptide repeat protein 39C-like isoform X2 [Culicoides brevitarsis]|uniref:tetratricopeptide repeat protein 39C-like isoform X2 n=1 Tax=Culicoides brevitarsis TaxID=469753 RepID=UPI00307BCB61
MSENKQKDASEMSESEYARVGIALWLNNKPLEAEDHFKKRKNKLQVEAGYTFISFLNAIISWETNKIEDAQRQLRELDKHCASENGWLKTVRVKLFGSNSPAKTLAQTLEEQIIMADSQLCSSILVGLTQDIGGMMKAGWSLRKAWKLYQTSYTQISELYRQKFQSNLHNNTNHKHHRRWSREEEDKADHDSSSKDDIQPYPLPTDSPSHCYDIPSFVIDDNDDKTKNNGHTSADNAAAATSTSSATTDANAVTTTTTTTTPKMPKSFTTTFSDAIQQQQQQSNSSPSTDNYPANNSTSDTDNASAVITARCLNKNASLDDELGGKSYRQSVTTSYSMNEFEPPYSSSSYHHQHPNAYQYHHYRSQCQNISKEDLQRLMSAVSFGYGLFQLSVSLLPPNLLKLISFFGFEGDRRTGITCLKHSRQSDDMRAPLATLSLLWYYTIITPFFALDGTNLDSEIEEANSLLEEASQDGFGEAALFLFFKGRVERLKSNIPAAVVAYETSHRKSMQREIKLLCLHEIGWCRLIQLEFGKAMNHFEELKHHSQFSKSFYAYMMAICQAAHGNMENLVAAREEIYGFISSSYMKDSQIEKYILRRVSKLPLEEIEREKFEQIYWKYLVYEMLIMWNAINSCSEDTLKVIMEDCKRPTRDLLNEPMKGLAKLVLATCHTCLKEYDEAIIAYRECIEQRGELLDDLHVSAFAHFELATLLLKHKNDKQEARRLLTHVQNNYHNYDFENRLGIRVHSMLKSIT